MSTENKAFDVMVIGGGPGGYIAAIRAAQLGMSVACIEMRKTNGEPALGGTCLNVGCIPSKALLDSSYKYHEATASLKKHGIQVENVRLDLSQMMGRKNRIVHQLTQGIAALFKANGVVWLQGEGRVTATTTVTVKADDGQETDYTAQYIVLATGSTPIDIPVAPMDGTMIVSSTGALEFDQVPEKLGIVGAGVIGLELGSVWSRLGSDVVVFEALNSFLPIADKNIAREGAKVLKKQGLDIKLSSQVQKASVVGDKVSVQYSASGEDETLVFDRLIVAVGRKPVTTALFGDGLLDKDERGFIQVNDYCQTSQDNIYAIGDIVRGPALAHKAMEEGVMVIERIAGEKTQVNYDAIPSVIYTHPEMAWVGLNEAQAVEKGYTVKTGSVPFAANGRALAADDSNGMVKFVADAATDLILGVHIIGPQASELVQQVVVALEFGATTEDLQLMVFGHPSLSEVVHEAALAVDGKALHIYQRPRKK